jgi:hypothetical protein
MREEREVADPHPFQRVRVHPRLQNAVVKSLQNESFHMIAQFKRRSVIQAELLVGYRSGVAGDGLATRDIGLASLDLNFCG